MVNKIELLAPARDLECGIAAVNCGADAVYIGGPKFSAREGASNSLEDIAKLIEYAHKYWVKVYVAINTILHDREIPIAAEIINKLYEAEIDAAIVQDMGLIAYGLPEIPLIASTQMNNATPEKILFLEQTGFKRAILARELSLKQIKSIHEAAPKIELECFIHGSLCVSYSGRCYLSYALGKRSGNRGNCAQPCRKLYTLTDHNNKQIAQNYTLSIKDLNLSSCLNDLVRAGVSAFKIEGRLKDKTYIKNVVTYYRKIIDGIWSEKNKNDLDKTFNRGFTTYFIHGKKEKIGSNKTPKMIGEFIAKAVTSDKKTITLDAACDLHPGDGISFFDNHNKLRGTLINSVKERIITIQQNQGLMAGTLIYRNHDHEFIARLNKAKIIRKIPVHMILKEAAGGLCLILEDEHHNKAEVRETYLFIPAIKTGEMENIILNQLNKTGATEFECTEVKLELPEIPFIPVSVLNNLRRKGLQQLSDIREQNRPKSKSALVDNNIPFPEKAVNVLNKYAEEYYRRHGVKKIERAFESGLDLRGKQVMTTKYCLKYELGLCPDKADMFLADENGHCLKLCFDCIRCGMDVYYM